MAKKFQVIAVDEGQFFHDLNYFAMSWTDISLDVIVTGLNSGIERKPYENMAQIAAAVAEEVHENLKIT